MGNINLDLDLSKEYYLKGNKIGCLVIHGFTGSPAELRQLGESLNNEGYSVLGVRLKGHGTTVEDLETCKYKDWIDSSVEGYNTLRKDCDKIYVVGHSMGALIALYIAENFHVDKLVTLSPPLINKNKAASFAFLIKYFMKYSEWEPRERPEEETKYLSFGYGKVPMKSVDEFNKLNKAVKKDLIKVKSPLLIVHSHDDETVDEKSIELLTNSISSEVKEKVFITKSGHNICVECKKQEVFDAVNKFLK